MKHIVRKRSESGFSLVELMIVVGIIGVLATLALPRFKQFQAKAKAAEAKNIISHLYTLEQTYSLDNNTYMAIGAMGANLGAPAGAVNCVQAAAQQLGFALDPCAATGPVPRFSYSVTNVGGATTNFQAIATTGTAGNNRICPAQGNGAYIVQLNETNTLSEPLAIGASCIN